MKTHFQVKYGNKANEYSDRDRKKISLGTLLQKKTYWGRGEAKIR